MRPRRLRVLVYMAVASAIMLIGCLLFFSVAEQSYAVAKSQPGSRSRNGGMGTMPALYAPDCEFIDHAGSKPFPAASDGNSCELNCQPPRQCPLSTRVLMGSSSA